MKVSCKRGLALLVLLSAYPLAYSAVARSATYSMDYAIPGAGGGLVGSSTYQVVGLIQTQGALCASSTSSTYDVEPLLVEPAGTSDVTDWMLY